MAGGSVDVPGMCGQDSSGERLPDAVDHVLPKVPNMGHCYRGQNHGAGWNVDRVLPLPQMQTPHRETDLR